MSKLQEFFLGRTFDDRPVEVPIKGIPFPFLIKQITAEEAKGIRKTCTKIEIDKKTRQKQETVDGDLYNARMLVKCCVDPNFKDADLQAHYGCPGNAERLVMTMFNNGQLLDLTLAMQEINGLTDDLNDMRDEAKNSSGAETT